MNFEDICQQYQTWVIRISSNSLSRPVFVIWLTDSTDEDHDKLVINHTNKIIASEDFESLLEEVFKVKSNLPDPMNTLTWLYKVRGLECTTHNYALETIEESIQSKAYNKKSIHEAINFMNLCGDFEEQTDDQEIRTLRSKPNIKYLWEYGYNEIIWKEVGSNEQIEPIHLPELHSEPELLNIEMSQLITAFLNRLEIMK